MLILLFLASSCFSAGSVMLCSVPPLNTHTTTCLTFVCKGSKILATILTSQVMCLSTAEPYRWGNALVIKSLNICCANTDVCVLLATSYEERKCYVILFLASACIQCVCTCLPRDLVYTSCSYKAENESSSSRSFKTDTEY